MELTTLYKQYRAAKLAADQAAKEEDKLKKALKKATGLDIYNDILVGICLYTPGETSAYLENDKFDIVVIKSQDRLQRNTLDWYIWIDRLTTHGKRLYMYLEDTFYSPDNALISGIKAILAEEYSRELSKKINNSYKRRIEAAKNGEKISIVNNSRSLGYDKVNGELVINEKEAEVVRMIFNMYASGEGLRAISNTLYDMGYRNRSGNEIDPTTISRMLSSEKYKGVWHISDRFCKYLW